MKTARKFALSSSSSSITTVIYTFHKDNNDHSTHTTNAIQIHSAISTSHSHDCPSPSATPIRSCHQDPIPLRGPHDRTLYKKISSVDSVANHLQRLIQRKETVDSPRSDEHEKLKMNEALMGLLLKLHSVPGIDLSIRERRKVICRIIGLQEILDGISEARIDDYDDAYGGWRHYCCRRDLDKAVEQMLEQRSATQVGMSSLQDSPTTVNVAHVILGRNKGN